MLNVCPGRGSRPYIGTNTMQQPNNLLINLILLGYRKRNINGAVVMEKETESGDFIRFIATTSNMQAELESYNAR